VTDIDSDYLGVCVAPPHLWVVQETVSEVVTFLMERKKLFHYYVWDIDRAYVRGQDGLDFGPGEQQLPRPDGVLDWKVLLHNLAASGYEGVASLKCHGSAGWPLDYVTSQFRASADYIRSCMPSGD
jgi:sugar phosphate isomerase/epimerase